MTRDEAIHYVAFCVVAIVIGVGHPSPNLKEQRQC